MDYHELRAMTIAQLREVAAGVEGLTGYTQMRKEQLLETVCEHLGIPLHEHHEVVGINKAAIKNRSAPSRSSVARRSRSATTPG